MKKWMIALFLLVALAVGFAAGFALQQQEITRLEKSLALLSQSPAPVKNYRAPPPAPPRNDGMEPPEGNAFTYAPPEPGGEEDRSRRGPPPWMNNGQGPDGSTNDQRRFDREAWVGRMATQMQVRAQRTRSNFVAKAQLSEDEATRFDVLVTSMNIRMQERIADWAKFAKENNLPRSELRARVMNEMSGVMVLTYDEMDRSMPTNWREEAGDDFNLYTFIDPNLWQEMRPLMGGRGQGAFRGGGGSSNSPARPPGGSQGR